MKWFKMESAIYENAKVQSLELPVLRTWLNLLGIYARYEGFPSTKQIAYITRQSLTELNSHIASLIKGELIDQDSEGTLTPHDWDQHNPYDLSTERVQKHRAQKQAKQTHETDETNETCFTVSENEHEMSKQMSKQVSKQVSKANGQMSKEVEQTNLLILGAEIAENKRKDEEISLGDFSDMKRMKQMKQMKRSRVEESRREENRKEENTHPYTPLSNFDEYENEQTQPVEKTSPSVFAESLNGNGNHPKPKNSLLTPEQQVWFDSLWADFWRKNDKHPAEKAFSKHIRSLKRFEELQAAFERDRAEMLTRPVDKRPCLGPWVNKKPWEDGDLADVPQQVKISPKEAASEAVYREYLAELENKGKTQ